MMAISTGEVTTHIANHDTVPEWIELAESAHKNSFDQQKWPLRALASFPSWDRIAFAVAKELKLKSLFEIGERTTNRCMRKVCRSLDASPLGIPLHPGAKQYYREKGYL